MSAWYDGVYLPRNRYTVPLVSLRDGLNSEKLWWCGERMPSHACMPAMRSGAVRNLFFANKSIQQHGSPAVHNVPQVRLSGTNRVAHLTIWNPTRLYAEHKHSPSHASLVQSMSKAFCICNGKLMLHRLALWYVQCVARWISHIAITFKHQPHSTPSLQQSSRIITDVANRRGLGIASLCCLLY